MLIVSFRQSQKIWNRNKNRTIFREKKTRATIPGLFARTLVSCWKSAHATGAVREPREVTIHVRYPLGRALFSYLFFASFFSHKIEISYENGPQNTPKVDTFGSCFQKMRENRKVRFDCTGAYGLYMSPHRGAPKATQNYTKNKLIAETFSFQEKSENVQKTTPERSPNRWLYIVLTSLWRPLGQH